MISTPAEQLLAAAAQGAGLLEPPERQVQVPASGQADADSGAEAEPDDVELVIGTSTLAAGRELSQRFPDAPVTLLAAGASAYGPTSGALQGRLAKRVRRVLHVDLVAGLDPLLLGERSVPALTVPLENVRAATAALPGPDPVPAPTTLVLGRTAPWAGALDRDAQTALLAAMVERCSEAGHSRIVLLLDEDTPAKTVKQLAKTARGARADVTVVAADGPVEPWLALDGVRLVVGSATEDLLVARRVFGRRVAQLDTDVVVKNLNPFDDPRRLAATLVDATVPDLRTWTSTPGGEEPKPIDPTGLMSTVAYAMQPDLLVDRRAAAIGFLEVHPGVRCRFIRRRRLGELRLPGGNRKVHKVLD